MYAWHLLKAFNQERRPLIVEPFELYGRKGGALIILTQNQGRWRQPYYNERLQYPGEHARSGFHAHKECYRGLRANHARRVSPIRNGFLAI